MPMTMVHWLPATFVAEPASILPGQHDRPHGRCKPPGIDSLIRGQSDAATAHRASPELVSVLMTGVRGEPARRGLRSASAPVR